MQQRSRAAAFPERFTAWLYLVAAAMAVTEAVRAFIDAATAVSRKNDANRALGRAEAPPRVSAYLTIREAHLAASELSREAHSVDELDAMNVVDALYAGGILFTRLPADRGLASPA